MYIKQDFDGKEEYIKTRMSKLNVDFDVNYTLFNAGFHAGYNNKTNSSASSQLTEQSFLFEQRLYKVEMSDFPDDKFTKNFIDDVNDLPLVFNEHNIDIKQKFQRFFNRWGHCVVTSAFAGGSLELKVSQRSDHANNHDDQRAFAEAFAKINAIIYGNYSLDSGYNRGSSALMQLKRLSESTEWFWSGGDSNLHNESSVEDSEQMAKWKLSLLNDPAMLTTEMNLIPISTIVALVDRNKNDCSYKALLHLAGSEFSTRRQRELQETNQANNERRREMDANLQYQQTNTRVATVQSNEPETNSSSCFPGRSRVWKRENGKVYSTEMRDLKQGDKILCYESSAGQTGFYTVITFAHNEPTSCCNYLIIHLNNGEIVRLSAEHLLMVGMRKHATMAINIKVGDTLTTIAGCELKVNIIYFITYSFFVCYYFGEILRQRLNYKMI